MLTLTSKSEACMEDGYDDILVEEYIAGQEFTVLVAANVQSQTFGVQLLNLWNTNSRKGISLKPTHLKLPNYIPMLINPANDAGLEAKLRSAAEKIFNGFSGVGYARLDFRVNEKQEVYFLEINFTCSVFYEDGYEGSADYILKFDPIGKAGFLKHIIAEGVARHAGQTKKISGKRNSRLMAMV
jgi:hypothetical protein